MSWTFPVAMYPSGADRQQMYVWPYYRGTALQLRWLYAMFLSWSPLLCCDNGQIDCVVCSWQRPKYLAINLSLIIHTHTHTHTHTRTHTHTHTWMQPCTLPPTHMHNRNVIELEHHPHQTTLPPLGRMLSWNCGSHRQHSHVVWSVGTLLLLLV